MRETIEKTSVEQSMRSPEIYRCQNRYKIGSVTMSPKIRRYRINHPEEPKEAKTPNEMSENKKALQKEIRRSIPGFEIKTAKAENRKGSSKASDKLTIYTEPYRVLRIKENKESPDIKKRSKPKVNPRLKDNARNTVLPLRHQFGKSRCKSCAIFTDPS